MSDLASIIRATRASANALAAMGHHARDAADCSAVIARNHTRVADRQLSAETAAIGNRIAIARKDAAMRAYKRACGRYDRAQITLARNPLPGDTTP